MSLAATLRLPCPLTHRASPRCTPAGVASERALFMDIVRKEIQNLGSMQEHGTATMAFTSKGLEVMHPEDAGTLAQAAQAAMPSMLTDRVAKILHRIEKELDVVESKIGNKLKVIDLDGDGLISGYVPYLLSYLFVLRGFLICRRNLQHKQPPGVH